MPELRYQHLQAFRLCVYVCVCYYVCLYVCVNECKLWGYMCGYMRMGGVCVFVKGEFDYKFV